MNIKGKLNSFALLVLSFLVFGSACSHAKDNTYTLVVEGYDWGPGASKVILPMEDSVNTAKATSFHVHAIRRTSSTELPPERAEGDRKVMPMYLMPMVIKWRAEPTLPSFYWWGPNCP